MPDVGNPTASYILTSQQREQELDEKCDLMVIDKPCVVKLIRKTDIQSDRKTTGLLSLSVIST